MKILFYSPHSQLYLNAPTGYGSHMRGMIKAFQLLGHEVDVLVMTGNMQENLGNNTSSQKNKTLKKFIPSIIWRTLKELNWLRFDGKARIELEKKIESFQPDLVYERSAWMSNGSVHLTKKYGIKHIVEINAPFEEEIKSFEGKYSLIHFIGKHKFKKLLRNCTAIASINSELTRVLSNTYNIDKEKFIFTPNAISEDEIELASQASIPAELDHLKNTNIFGFVGSLLPYHGIDVCIKAFSKMKGANAHLLIVGDGYLIPAYQKLCEELEISDQVTFTGSIPKCNIWNYLYAMSMVLLPDTGWYCSPVKLFEYALIGRPIIAAKQPGVTDIFNEKECTFFSGREEELSTLFQEFLKHPEKFETMGKQCKEIVIRKHQWTNNAIAILNSIES